MSESQLIASLGPPASEQSYGGNRRRLGFTGIKLHVVVDTGIVVFIAPLDASYATSSGLRIGSPAAGVATLTGDRTTSERSGTISHCFADKTLVTVAGDGATMPQSVCATGTVCDIALGGC